MNDEITVEEEVSSVKMDRPHVVVLGAGASRAVCPKGDKNGKILPLMADFAKVVGLEDMLTGWGIDSSANFEDIYSDLALNGETIKLKEIENLVEGYFSKLQLPDKPTVYDHLILSLRSKDIIATFNWDPLLLEAYQRNSKSGLTPPSLYFLHGNISVGYCEKDQIKGKAGDNCEECGLPFIPTPLLYPIGKKDYASNHFIANEWRALKNGFKNAFMITIFGYSGPKTDQEAIEAMKDAWGNVGDRNMEQTSFITKQKENEVVKNWKPFIHTHHYELQSDFYESWIANHPRRTGEAYWNQYFEAKFISNNPIPRNYDFPKLWEWYNQFKKAEGLH